MDGWMDGWMDGIGIETMETCHATSQHILLQSNIADHMGQ